MRLVTLLASTALVATTLGLGIPTSNHVVHERRDNGLHAWTKRQAVHQSALLPMRIGLTQSNLDKGPDLLMEVYVTI